MEPLGDVMTRPVRSSARRELRGQALAALGELLPTDGQAVMQARKRWKGLAVPGVVPLEAFP